ncbi:hypothetical protein Hanom_Chr13g01235841 [Helianthus anomalus]
MYLVYCVVLFVQYFFEASCAFLLLLLPIQFSHSELDLGLMRREGSREKDSPAIGGEETKNNAMIH